MTSILEFEVPGELILGLFQLLPLIDVFFLDVLDFCLHCLQLSKELEDRNIKETRIAKMKRTSSIISLKI